MDNIQYGDKPFGLNQIVLVSADGLVEVALPASRTLEFEEILVTGEFNGDDGLQGVMSQPVGIKGKMEGGGIPLAAYAMMTGHTINTTGSTPNLVTTLEGDSNRFPYFKVYGKSLDDESGDVHVKLLKVKLTSGLKGSFKYGEFFASEYEFMGVKDGDKAYEVVANETAATLPGATGSPSALSVTPVPADGASGVNVADDVVLTFNNALKAGSESGILLVRSDTQAPIACTRTLSANRKVVTLNPSSNLTAAKTYLVILAGVTDIYDQTLADSVVNFDTA